MFGFLKVRRGRRAAIDTLAPLVARSRARNPHIPENVWLSPHLVGLMGGLITLAAKRRTGSLDEQTLAIVQAQAWAALTGIEGDLFGEEMYLLSTDPDDAFKSGCSKAAELFGLITGEPVPALSHDDEGWSNAFWHVPRPEDDAVTGMATPHASTADALAVWDACFEAHLHLGRSDAKSRS
jgi:hypothetical protein